MKKALYITNQDLFDYSGIGVSKKINGQIIALKKYNINCDLIAFKNGNIFFKEDNDEKTIKLKMYIKSKRISLYREILKRKNLKTYNFIYIRYFYSDPIFLFMLRNLKRINNNIKIIIEIPTYPYKKELTSYTTGKIMYFIDSISNKFINKFTDIILTSSSENKIFGIKTLNIENGIDINSLNITKRKRIKNENKLNMLGIANINFWHGYDRVINGLIEYYKIDREFKVYFDLVGESNYCEKLKKLVDENNLSDYVKFNGIKIGKELDEFYMKAHIAVGSLGIHRLNLSNVSTLKSKEYFSRGIPFIKAYDEKFMESLEFKCSIEFNKDDSNIDIEYLIKEYEKLDIENISNRMIEYSMKNLTWEAQLKELIGFLMYE